MRKELGVERFRFTCTHCQHTWITDYDVQHVEDGHGHDCAYYSLNGLPVIAPTAPAAYLCPGCGASRIQITLIARRDIPLAPTPPPPTATATRPGHCKSTPPSGESPDQAPHYPASNPPHPPNPAPLPNGSAQQTADLPLPLRQRRERCRTALLPLVGAIRRSSLWTDIVTRTV